MVNHYLTSIGFFDQDREDELVWNGKTNRAKNIVLPLQTIGVIKIVNYV